MAYMNRFNLSDEHRRNELIRIVEHSVESALAESRTSYCTIKGTDEDCLSRQSFCISYCILPGMKAGQCTEI